jgi:hypothetical protein
MRTRNRRLLVWGNVRDKPELEATLVMRLAIRYHVSIRTIYRDIESLKAGGFIVPPFAYRKAS